ncbi:Pr6Pr family membrane protein [Alloscardovia macacae]|uniref:Uncharacterized protein n=1 Tax=Alloscardovia macacae TaxID=1160091 RepID=A0A261F6Z3_9BIFI|nr:Pr6Pr family membrane protein [Alloscardovia macacae]OZG54848.1 hypothetical protein ALMA_0173 [Alloscardovia macacae]
MSIFHFAPRAHHAKRALTVVAVVAWFGVILTNLGNVFDIYPRESGNWPGLYGHSAHGWPGAAQRFIEGISYFTMISNILVAVVFTLLAISFKRTFWRVVFVDTALLMITVTSLVFLTAILPFLNLNGLALLTSPWQHVIVPVSVWVVWLLWGPRGFSEGYSRWRVMLSTLIIPALWSVWMLTYGALTSYYPYGFVNVNQLGYGGVVISLLVVMALGLVLEGIFIWLDRILMRR